MTNPCNQLSLNEAALMSILRDEAQNALELEGQKLLIHMRQGLWKLQFCHVSRGCICHEFFGTDFVKCNLQ